VSGQLKSVARNMVRRSGWSVHRYRVEEEPAYQVLQALDHVGVNTIFDIGANTGGFAQSMRRVGYAGHIVSFEPLSAAHAKLRQATQETNGTWIAAERCAIGERDGSARINIANNSVSSSLLPMAATHREAAPESIYVGAEEVVMFRLDTVADKYALPMRRRAIKIDAQGYEWQILDGAENTLKTSVAILCELSFVPLYEGQKLWRDVIDRLERQGFTLWVMQRGFTDSRTGRSLQANATFLRLP
jgi:FkbM family methyltransferase